MFFNKKNNKKDEIFVILDNKISDAKLSPRKKEWTEESFIEYQSAGDFYDEPASLNIDFDKKKFNQIFSIIILGLFVLLGRSIYLQILQGDKYRSLAEGNRIRIQTVKAQRGLIFDSNGVQLVKNEPKFALTVVPADLPKEEKERAKIIGKISQIIKKTPKDIEEIIAQVNKNSKYYYQPIIIEDYLDYNSAILYNIESEKLFGVQLFVSSYRSYNNKEEDGNTIQSLSHVLGYSGKITPEELEKFANKDYLFNDTIGKNGLELFYEDELKGIDGKNYSEFDALGKSQKVLAEEKPHQGKNIVLSLDLNSQAKLENILKDYLDKYKKSKGVAIALNPQNGKIIALVSLPAYDINDFSKGISQEKFQGLLDDPNNPLLNRSIQGEYPSGSTFKPIVASAALEEGIVNEFTTFYSTGGIRIGEWFFPDWRAGGHGATSVKKALADSVNTYFYIVGGGYQNTNGLGHKRIIEYASMFGLGKPLGIDLPGEKSGFLPDAEWKEKAKNEAWYIGDTYHLAIGQGDLLVTPLQIAMMTSVFANDGVLQKPELVDYFEDIETKEKTKLEPEIINKDFISANNIDIVNRGLRQAVLSGSARTLLTLPVTSAGKTGTAQWNTQKDNHAWFTCYAPYEDPQIVVTVLIEEGIEGSLTSINVAKDFLNWYFSIDKENNSG